MGLNNEGATRIVFDIETAPLPEARDYLIEPVEAPANYRDPIKIAAYIEEKKAKQFDNCSLDPDLCQIVAISGWIEGAEQPFVCHAGALSEADMLEYFWRKAVNRHLVGYNCLAFDVPVLLRRSLYLGLPTPLIQVDKYRHPGVTDLQSILSFNGTTEWHSLDFYAKRFGFVVEDGLTGADIGTAVREARWHDIETHVLADVRKTALLAARCGYFTQPVVASVF